MKRRSTLRFLLEGVEGIVLMLLTVLAWPFLGFWLRNLGSTRAERERTWPGDDLVADATSRTTRAIAVRAPASSVWPWLVQFGLNRAGFYSYELLERLARIPVRNVESVQPEWQDLSVGDEVLLGPAVGLRVSKLAEGEALCFGKQTQNGADASDVSWSFYVTSSSEASCRLLIRTCVAPLAKRSPWGRMAGGLERALDFVMERRMLRTVTRLAERA